MIAQRKTWSRIKNILIVSASVSAILAVGYGVYVAIHSPLFLVKVVEVSDLPEQAPVDAQAISALAAIPLGQVNLADLSLAPIEQRILAHPWVREVQLRKRFPHTVSISVTLREPRALLQKENGDVAYVDGDGKVFGGVNLAVQSDLPLLSGLETNVQDRLAGLKLLEHWGQHPGGIQHPIASLSYDAERGFRAMMTYSLSRMNTRARAMVTFGPEIEPEYDAQFTRLTRVLKYLSDNNIVARQVWADAGKKIVVKIAHGS